MAAKTVEDINSMTDEELLEAHARGELGEADGTNAEQREEEEENENEGEESGSEDEGEENEGQEEGEEGEENEEGDGNVTVAGKTYTQEEYAALLEELEASDRAVPQSRLMEEVNRRRQMEKDNTELQLKIARTEGAAEAMQRAEEAARLAAEAAKPKYDFDKAEETYAALIEEGKKTDAAALRREIREETAKQSRAENDAAIKAARAETAQEFNRLENKRAMEMTAAALYSRFPFLDHNSEKADKTALYATIALRDELIKKGKSPVEALHEAMITIGEAEVKKNPAKGGKVITLPAKDQRRAQALRKAIKANERQPPRGGGIGNRMKDGKLSEKDIRKMSDEDFAKLTDEQLAALDGRSSQQRQRG